MRIRGNVAAVVAAGAAVVLLAGCSPRDTDNTAPTGGTETPAPIQLVSSLPAGTQTVDTVTWGLREGEPALLAPGGDYNYVTPNLCDSLLRVTPDFGIESGIAEKAEWADPVTFVIDLRAGVTFWDGTPVTPEDVVYSLERNRDQRSAFYGATVLIVPGPDGIAVTGPNQVTVRFVAPDSTFRDSLAGGAGAVLSKAFGDEVGPALGTSGAGVMCAGPYKFESWTPGQEIVTVANEDYWGGAPKVGKIVYKFVPDGTTLTNALLAGEIDGAFNVAAASRGQFESSDAGRLVVGPSTASFSFGPTRAEGLGANVKIRQALSMAIDRSQYITTVLNGLGEPQSTFVAPFAWQGMEAADIYRAGYDALPAPTLDVAAAKKLVEESGEDTTQPLRLVIPAGNKELSQTAAIIQSAAQSIGLTAEIDERQAADYAAMFSDPFNEGLRADTDLIVATGYTETPGALTYPQLFLMPVDQGGIFNWTHYSNPEVTAALGAARTTPDPAGAAAAYVDAQKIFAPDQLQVTLAGAYQTSFLSDKLSGIVTSIAAYSSPWALALGGK